MPAFHALSACTLHAAGDPELRFVHSPDRRRDFPFLAEATPPAIRERQLSPEPTQGRFQTTLLPRSDEDRFVSSYGFRRSILTWYSATKIDRPMHISSLALAIVLTTMGLRGQPVRWDVVDSVGVELWDVDCPDSVTCFAVGSRQYYPDRSLVLRSTNAGKSWEIVYDRRADTTQSVIPGLRRIAAVGPLTVVAAGDSGVVLRSTDGGRSWTGGTMPRQLAVARLSIHRSGAGMALLVDPDIGMIVPTVTSDAGATWRETSFNAPGMRGSRCVSVGNRGAGSFICPVFDESSFDLIESKNGGVDWRRVLPAWRGFEIIAFADENVGWGVLGNAHATEQRFRIARTVDGGLTWLTFDDQSRLRASSYDISPVDSLSCILGSSRGEILRTTDGGLIIVQDTVPIGGSVPIDVSAMSSTSAVAVSRTGQILLARFPQPSSTVPEFSEEERPTISPNVLRVGSTLSSTILGTRDEVERAALYDIVGGEACAVDVTIDGSGKRRITLPPGIRVGLYTLVFTDRLGRKTTARLLVR